MIDQYIIGCLGWGAALFVAALVAFFIHPGILIGVAIGIIIGALPDG